MKIKSGDVAGWAERQQLPGVILLHGSDQGLIEACARMIQQKLLGSDPDADVMDFDVENFHAADLVLERLQVACEVRPLFIARRLIVVREGQNLTASTKQGICQWLAKSRLPSDTLLLVMAGELLETRDPLRRWCEADAAAWCVTLYPLEGHGWRQWLRQQLMRAGLSATEDALTYLAEYLAGDTQAALNELDKLYLYLGSRRQIDGADVLAVVGETVEYSGHAWAAALLSRNRTQALRILTRLLENGQEPLMLLGGVIRRLRQMIRLQHLLHQGVPQAKALAETQVFWKDQQHLIDQLQHWSERALADALLACCDTDAALKGGDGVLRPAAETLERLVLRLIHPSETRVTVP
ncbi:MAG: DNA polymerase III subunit delta [Magnetococcales bacterium]|nr:DNA polymerase III subunit delta [Magnetococcales bacterium]